MGGSCLVRPSNSLRTRGSVYFTPKDIGHIVPFPSVIKTSMLLKNNMNIWQIPISQSEQAAGRL